MERPGSGVQKFRHAFHISHLIQPGVDDIRPVALQQQTGKGDSRPEEERAERSGRRAEPGVESSDHDRPGRSQPQRTHDLDEHVDIVQLRHEERNEDEETADRNRHAAQPPEMFPRGERLFPERHDYVLHNRARRVENARVVSREHQHDHQQREKSHQRARQEAAQQHRHHHLIVERAEFLEHRRTVFDRVAEQIVGAFQVGRVGILSAGIGLVHTDHVGRRRNRLVMPGKLFADRLVRNHLVRHPVGQFDADVAGLFTEVVREHDHHHGQSDQGAHQHREAGPPGAEHTSHLLFMRGAAGAGCVVADPAGAVENAADDGDYQTEDVEVAQLVKVHRVEEALSGRPVEHDRRDVVHPGDVAQHEDSENHEDRVAEQPLEAVGDDQRDAASGQDDDGCERDYDDDHDHEGRHGHSPDGDRMGEAEEVDEEAGGNRRGDGVGDHFRNRPDRRGDYTKRPVVTHFEELADRETAGLAGAVDAVAGQRHEDAHRNGQLAPESHGHAALVLLFTEGDEGDDGESRLKVTNTDDVSPGDTSGGEVIGDAPHIPLGVTGRPEDGDQRQNDDEPTDPVHLKILMLLLNMVADKENALLVGNDGKREKDSSFPPGQQGGAEEKRRTVDDMRMAG